MAGIDFCCRLCLVFFFFPQVRVKKKGGVRFFLLWGGWVDNWCNWLRVCHERHVNGTLHFGHHHRVDGVESMGKKGKTQTHTTKNRVVDDDMMTVFRRIVDGDSQTEVEGKKKKKKKKISITRNL